MGWIEPDPETMFRLFLPQRENDLDSSGSVGTILVAGGLPPLGPFHFDVDIDLI